MVYLATSLFLFALWTGVVGYLLYRKRECDQNEVRRLFIRFWSGREEDRYPSWLCVRHELLKREGDSACLRLVDRQIRMEDRQKMLSAYCVDEQGNIRRDVRRRVHLTGQ